MGKVIFLSLLFILVTMVTVTMSVPEANEIELDPNNIGSMLAKEQDGSSSETSDDSTEDADNNEQILCNVLVQAIRDLYSQQGKSENEIISYLDTDCANLENEELVKQCREMVAQYSGKIYEYVTDGKAMSQICERIEGDIAMSPDNETTSRCSGKGKDKCQCCKRHVEKRKMRFRFIVKLIARRRLQMCKKAHRPERCREHIRQKERRILKKIDQICPYRVCKHFGYCESQIDTTVDLTAQWLGQFNQQLETYFTGDVCSQFEGLHGLCNHLAASNNGRYYVRFYKAILDNDTKSIDNALIEDAANAKGNGNSSLCDKCKEAVQSSIDTYLQLLDTTRNTLDSLCEKCPAKDKCEEYFNDRIDNIKSYLKSIKPENFCSTIHLCDLSPPAIPYSLNRAAGCDTCIERMQPHKDAVIEAVNRFAEHFTDQCAQSDIPQCVDFIADMATELRSFIREFNISETCLSMGFCGADTVQNIVVYEQALIDEFSKVCARLGPLQTFCQQVIQGNSKQLQTIDLEGVNIEDLFSECESDDVQDITASDEQCTKDDDKCRCCIKRIIRKKKCLKKRVAMFISRMLELCKRCPAQEQCDKFWEEKKAYWDAKIDRICPKKICIRKGSCPKVETSVACDYMGPLKQLCQQASTAVGNFLDDEPKKLFKALQQQMGIDSKDESKE